MTRFVLPPKMQQARNWVRSTDALRSALHARLGTIQERAAAKRKEADEIEREGTSIEAAIQLLDQLLPPKKGQAPALASPATRPGFTVDRLFAGAAPVPALVAAVDGKPWSPNHSQCAKCGTTEKKHAALGFCTRCYWQETHPKSGDQPEGSGAAHSAESDLASGATVAFGADLDAVVERAAERLAPVS